MKKSILPKQPYVSFNGHGIDIACKRSDDLDKLSIENFNIKTNVKVIDIGCGAGGHSIRMAKAGVKVTAIDEHNFNNEFDEYRKTENLSIEQLEFICGDITELTELVSDKIFTDAYTQRTLHYLKYEQALELLKVLYRITEDKLYISATGIDSGVGESYIGKKESVNERFFSLNTEKAETYSIHEPVCLYSKAELVSLLEKAGWTVERCWQSDFGNLKAVCTH